MPNALTNAFLDTVGIGRAVFYRTFIERKWKPPQPMFNVLEVKEGQEECFETFLAQAQGISEKLNTPVSLGPFKTEGTRIYIYVTHYASTSAFIGVMFRLTFSLVTFKRCRATQWTSWTYCEPTEGTAFSELKNVLVVGVQGDTAALSEMLREHGISPAGTVARVKDVRGRSQGFYFVLADNNSTFDLLEEFRDGGGDIVIYRAAAFE